MATNDTTPLVDHTHHIGNVVTVTTDDGLEFTNVECLGMYETDVIEQSEGAPQYVGVFRYADALPDEFDLYIDLTVVSDIR